MGVAGADLTAHAIRITGLGGLFAGACSLALRKWLSSTPRDSTRRQIATEAEELVRVPEEEQEDLADLPSQGLARESGEISG
jgi:hypothetical protein